ncbi:MAG: DUF177 domain-containing protein [Paracoccaceae bacterium]
MPDLPAVAHPIRLADLSARKPTRFALSPDAATRDRIAAHLGISAVEALDFVGDLRPSGKKDWTLNAQLGARVVQPCVVTLTPVTTDIAEPVTRRFMADLPEPEDEEVEMPEDDTVEPLPAVVDLGAVMVEALALALPLYPRAEGAEFGQAQFAEPGTPPLSDEALRPFAGLSDLMKKGMRKD